MNKPWLRSIAASIATIFTFTSIIPPSYAGVITNLPAPLPIAAPIQNFAPLTIKGLTVDSKNPLRFDFIVDTGTTSFKSEESLRKESLKVVKYFLASLTVPAEDLWVNLSPYEKNRIVPEGFGETEMGRDLLTQDFILKQLTASLMHPDKEFGKVFWKRVQSKAQNLFGTKDVPMDTINRIWIVPEKATVYEHENTAYVIESHLKVMLEEDLTATDKWREAVGKNSTIHIVAKDDLQTTQIIREILIPEIEQEVNKGAMFANLRQIYNSLILALWYKENLRQSLLGQVYFNQNKTKGIDFKDKTANQQTYTQYLEAFKKGAYDLIREDYDPATQQVIPRKYFSGGTTLLEAQNILTTVFTAAPNQTITAGTALSLSVDMVDFGQNADLPKAEESVTVTAAANDDQSMTANTDSIEALKNQLKNTGGAISVEEVRAIIGNEISDDDLRMLLFQLGNQTGVFGPIHDVDIKSVNTDVFSTQIGIGGKGPYTRGMHASLATQRGGRAPGIKRYGSEGTADESNAILRDQLAQGNKFFSIAYDLPTQNGYDSDSEQAEGEVGRVGVAIDTLKDVEDLVSGMPTAKIAISNTINPTAIIIMVMQIVAARKQGTADGDIKGSIQNEILKEFLARGTFVHGYPGSMRLTLDIFNWTRQNLPHYNTITMSGYHAREKGANEVQEIAYAMTNALQYLAEARRSGLDDDALVDILNQIAWFMNLKIKTFEEVAKLRALRRVWFALVTQAFGFDLQAVNMKKIVKSFRSQTWSGGSDVQYAKDKILTNIVRNAFRALNAGPSGAQGWDGAAFDEAVAIPKAFQSGLAMDRLRIIQEESGVLEFDDSLGGSYELEVETNRIEEEAWRELAAIAEQPSFPKALKYMKSNLERQAEEETRAIATGEKPIVGQNTNMENAHLYPNAEQKDAARRESYDEKQIKRLNQVKASRDNEAVQRSLDALESAARTEENLIPYIFDAVESYATIQEMTDRLRRVFGATGKGDKNPWDTEAFVDSNGVRWEPEIANDNQAEVFDAGMRQFILQKRDEVGTRNQEISKAAKERGYYQASDLRFVAQTADSKPGEFPYKRGIGIVKKPAKADMEEILIGYAARDTFGVSAEQEMAYSLYAALKYVDSHPAEEQTEAAKRIKMVLTAHDNFFEEISKFRALRTLWAKLMQERGITDPNAQKLYIKAKTAESTLTETKYWINIHRSSLQALAARLGEVQEIEVSPFDSPYGETEYSELARQLGKDTLAIIDKELGLDNITDPMGGAFVVESLTDILEIKALRELNKLLALQDNTQTVQEIPEETGASQTLLQLDEATGRALSRSTPALQQYVVKSVQAAAQRTLVEYTAGLRKKVGKTVFQTGARYHPQPRIPAAQKTRLALEEGDVTIEALASSDSEVRTKALDRWIKKGFDVATKVRSALGTNNEFKVTSGLIQGLYAIHLAVNDNLFEAIKNAWNITTTDDQFTIESNNKPNVIVKRKQNDEAGLTIELGGKSEAAVETLGLVNSQSIEGLPLRILMSKAGLDGHDRGVRTVGAIFDAAEGLETGYTGLHATPSEIVEQAIAGEYDVIGLSILSDAHNTLIPKIAKLLAERGRTDILLIVGGVIPLSDHDFLLNKAGVSYIYAGTPNVQSIIDDLRAWNKWRQENNITEIGENNFTIKLPDGTSIPVIIRNEEVPVIREVSVEESAQEAAQYPLAQPVTFSSFVSPANIPLVSGLWSADPAIRKATEQHFAAAGDLLIETIFRAHPYIQKHGIHGKDGIVVHKGRKSSVASAGIALTREHFLELEELHRQAGHPLHRSKVPADVGADEVEIHITMPDGTERILDILTDTPDSKKRTLTRHITANGESIQQVEIWTDDIEAAQTEIKTRSRGDGVFITLPIRQGANGSKIFFTMVGLPGNNTMLVEFVQRPTDEEVELENIIYNLPSVQQGYLKIETVDGTILEVTVDRQDYTPINGLSSQMLKDLVTIIETVNLDDHLDGIILTGSGRAFIGGGDLNEVLSAQTPDDIEALINLGLNLTSTIARSEKPVVIAANGPLVGGGSHIAISSDAVVMSKTTQNRKGEERPNYFVHPELAPMKYIPAWGAMRQLPRLIGPKEAIRIFLAPNAKDENRPQSYDADYAKEIGYADLLVEPNDLQPAAIRKLRELASLTPLKRPRNKNAKITDIDRKEARELFNDKEIHQWLSVHDRSGRGNIARNIIRIVQLAYEKGDEAADQETIQVARTVFLASKARTAIKKTLENNADASMTAKNEDYFKYYDEGVPRTLEFPDVSFPELLEQQLDRDGNAIALTSPGSQLYSQLTYQQLNNHVNRFANGLIKEGVKKGDRVALMVPQSAQHFIAYLAIIKIGAIAVLTNSRFKTVELKRQFAKAEPKIVIALDSHVQQIVDVNGSAPSIEKIISVSSGDLIDGTRNNRLPRSPIPTIIIPWNKVTRSMSIEKPDVDIVSSDPAILQYSSGATTGEPELVIWTHKTLVAAVLQRQAWIYSDVEAHSDRVFNAAYTHTSMLSAFTAGMQLIVYPNLRLPGQSYTDKIIDVIAEQKPTVISGIPIGYHKILTHPKIVQVDWRQIRVASSFGSTLPTELIRGFEEKTGIQIIQGLGHSEIPGGIHEPIKNPRPGSVGIPLPGVRIKITNPESGQEVKQGESGELWMQGPQHGEGYWQNMQAYAEKVTTDGWIKTGDLVSQDEDGYLYHRGRINNLIILSGSYRVNPRELESALRKHPKIRNAAVVGVPGAQGLTVLKAVIVPKNVDDAPTANEVRKFLNSRNLESYKIPAIIEIRNQGLPRGALGKIARYRLQEEQDPQIYLREIQAGKWREVFQDLVGLESRYGQSHKTLQVVNQLQLAHKKNPSKYIRYFLIQLWNYGKEHPRRINAETMRIIEEILARHLFETDPKSFFNEPLKNIADQTSTHKSRVIELQQSEQNLNTSISNGDKFRSYLSALGVKSSENLDTILGTFEEALFYLEVNEVDISEEIKSHIYSISNRKNEPDILKTWAPIRFRETRRELIQSLSDILEKKRTQRQEVQAELDQIFNTTWPVIRDAYNNLTARERFKISRIKERPKAADIADSFLFRNVEIYTDPKDPLNIAAGERYVPEISEVQQVMHEWGFDVIEATEYVIAKRDALYDDESVLTGRATFVDPQNPNNQHEVMIIGLQKGKNSTEEAKRNLGLARPWGYWKAIRAMRLAEKLNIPIVTFVDTLGADNGLPSEINNQPGAVSYAIEYQQKLNVPAIHFIVGEAGSAGSMTATQAGPLWMLASAQRFVAVPEGGLSILSGIEDKLKKVAKERGENPDQAENLYRQELINTWADALQADAQRSLKAGSIAGIIGEMPGGFHRFADASFVGIGKVIAEFLESNAKKSPEQIKQERYDLWRKLGAREGQEFEIKDRALTRTKAMLDKKEFESVLSKALISLPSVASEITGADKPLSMEETLALNPNILNPIILEAFTRIRPGWVGGLIKPALKNWGTVNEKNIETLKALLVRFFRPERLSIQDRLEQLVDSDDGRLEILSELNPNIADIQIIDFESPLAEDFPEIFRTGDTQKAIESARKTTGSWSGLFTGYVKMGGVKTMLIIKDPRWFAASATSSVVGEKITRALEDVHQRYDNEGERIPVVFLNTASGAVQQEGQRSMDPLNKQLAALTRLEEIDIPVVILGTNHIFGGDSASSSTYQNASLLLLETGTKKGFTGPRSVEKAEEGRRSNLGIPALTNGIPSIYQTAEFAVRHGYVDGVLTVQEERDVLHRFLQTAMNSSFSSADTTIIQRVRDLKERAAARKVSVKNRENGRIYVAKPRQDLQIRFGKIARSSRPNITIGSGNGSQYAPIDNGAPVAQNDAVKTNIALYLAQMHLRQARTRTLSASRNYVENHLERALEALGKISKETLSPNLLRSAQEEFEKTKNRSKNHSLLNQIQAKLNQLATDGALIATDQSKLKTASTPVGGINLNPALFDLQIKRDGSGIPLPLNQQPLEIMNIEGFLPVIINITPITNLPFLLGLADDESDSNEFSHQNPQKAREEELVSYLN